jgi:hypothetical protein
MSAGPSSAAIIDPPVPTHGLARHRELRLGFGDALDDGEPVDGAGGRYGFVPSRRASDASLPRSSPVIPYRRAGPLSLLEVIAET